MSRLGACVDSTLTWIGNNKLSSFLIVCTFAFIVSTWTLAAINADLNRQLEERNHHSDETTTIPQTTTISQTTEEPKNTTTVKTTLEPPVNSTLEGTNGHGRRRRFA